MAGAGVELSTVLLRDALETALRVLCEFLLGQCIGCSPLVSVWWFWGRKPFYEQTKVGKPVLVFRLPT